MSPKDTWAVRGVNLVYPGLWVGSGLHVTANLLKTHNINTLVWATPEVSLPSLPETVRVIKVLVRDDPNVDLSSFFPIVAAAFKESQGMAVVCRAGVSRSASLALAAIVGQADANVTLKRAYEIVKASRKLIRPNPGFFAQLIAYERKVRGTASVAMVPSPFDSLEEIPDVYLEELRRLNSKTFSIFIPL